MTTDREAFVQRCWSLLDDDMPAWRILDYLVSTPADIGPDSVDKLLLADGAMLALTDMGVLSYEEHLDRWDVLLLRAPAVSDEELRQAAERAAAWGGHSS